MNNAIERSAQVPPEELNGSTPRSVVLSDNARRAALGLPIISVIVLIITIVIVRTQIPQIRTRIALRSDTRLAVAQITSLHSGGRGVEIVEYTFNGAGKPASGSAKVPYDYFQLMRDSKQIIVRYLPSDPAVNHPDTWEWSPGAEEFFGFFAFVCFWFVGILGIVYPIRLMRRLTIIRCGRPALATIETFARDGRVFSYGYSFRSDDGIERKGKDSTTGELTVGSQTWLLYLTQKPQRNCLYPSTEFEIAS